MRKEQIVKHFKKITALCASVVLGVCSVISSSSTALAADTNTADVKTSSVPEGFVYADGTHFMCDGVPFYFAGCNGFSRVLLKFYNVFENLWQIRKNSS